MIRPVLIKVVERDGVYLAAASDGEHSGEGSAAGNGDRAIDQAIAEALVRMRAQRDALAAWRHEQERLARVIPVEEREVPDVSAGRN